MALIQPMDDFSFPAPDKQDLLVPVTGQISQSDILICPEF